jgi:phenylacetate-CoA ligase
MELKPQLSPKALVSSAMKLTEGMRKKLESFFKCPVLDIYSLTECRMIAVADEGNRYRAIRPELFLEVFEPVTDTPVKTGERGELVVTGGNNPFLPLIRYRTGDFCSLHFENDVLYLIDLEARKPVALYKKDGSFVNNIEVSRAMMDLPLAGFSLHQNADKSILFTGWSSDKTLNTTIHQELQKIFGQDCNINVNIKHPEANSSKPVSYSSDLNSDF